MQGCSKRKKSEQDSKHFAVEVEEELPFGVCKIFDQSMNYCEYLNCQFNCKFIQERMSKKQQHPQTSQQLGFSKADHAKLTEQLIDLYLSVKIRSNEEIDNYSEEILQKERKKLRDVDTFTVVDYIKTSIEILMNMKQEEQDMEKENRKDKTRNRNGFEDTQSVKSMDEPPKDYEAMLQKYEAEVRNHIKIEQQLKLHIECVQDKLDDSEKALQKTKKEKTRVDDEVSKDLIRYKDLLGLREKEIDSLKSDYRKLQKVNDDFRRQIERMEKDFREFKSSSMTSQLNKEASFHQRNNQGIPVGNLNEKSQNSVLDEFQYSKDHYSQDFRSKVAAVHPSSSQASKASKTQLGSFIQNDQNSMSDKNLELIRLKKEYHQMVRKELSKDQDPYGEGKGKSPDRGHNSSVASNSQYQTSQSSKTPNPYLSGEGSRSQSQKRNGIQEKQVLKDNNGKQTKQASFQPQQMAVMNGVQSSTGAGGHKRHKSQNVNNLIMGVNPQTFIKPSGDDLKIKGEGLDQNQAHHQSFAGYIGAPQFTDASGFTSNTVDNRVNHTSHMTGMPASILSGTYINSNIIVHQKHIDSNPQRAQAKKVNQKRQPSVHEEKKMIPNESAKHIIQASGGHMRTGSYDMVAAALMQQHNQSFVSQASNQSYLSNTKKKTNTTSGKVLQQNYLSAGATQTSFHHNSSTNSNGHGSNALDSASFDNGQVKRPQTSQMSSYQRKNVQKNSMLAVANSKKSDPVSMYPQKRGETTRDSPSRF